MYTLKKQARKVLCVVGLVSTCFISTSFAHEHDKKHDEKMNKGREGVIYVVSNDPVDNGNAILAYRNDGHGNLSPLKGSPYPTGGKGYTTLNTLPHFGPFDADQNIMLSEDGNRLFSTNGGSDTIAVFDVHEDGSLTAVEGSPFPSMGKNPVSIGLTGDRLYVVNKNEDPSRDMTVTLPNYTGFNVLENGTLEHIEGSTIELDNAWRSPTQALIVEDKFIFDSDFGRFPLTARTEQWGDEYLTDTQTTIRSMRINEDGTLTKLADIDAPNDSVEGAQDTNGDGVSDPLNFGLQKHPTENLVYVSFVTNAKMGIFEYDDEGVLTYLGAAENSGNLICWIVITDDGKHAFTTNNASDTLSVYDVSDARNPKEIQTIDLKGYGSPYQMTLSSDEKWLYIVKHRTFDKTPVGDGSVLNVLKVNEDGSLVELGTSPETLPVRDDLLARPQGVAAH